jgi:hypothetical protein
MAVFQFYLHSGKQRKLEMVGDDSHVAFGKKIPCEKGSLTVRCHEATASSFVANVSGEVFAHFLAADVKCHSSMWNRLFDLPRLPCEQSPRCQRK